MAIIVQIRDQTCVEIVFRLVLSMSINFIKEDVNEVSLLNFVGTIYSSFVQNILNNK